MGYITFPIFPFQPYHQPTLRVLKVRGHCSTLLTLRTIDSMRAGRRMQADPAPLLRKGTHADVSAGSGCMALNRACRRRLDSLRHRCSFEMVPLSIIRRRNSAKRLPPHLLQPHLQIASMGHPKLMSTKSTEHWSWMSWAQRAMLSG